LLSSPPLVAAVRIALKDAESPGSDCMGVKVRSSWFFFFPSEAVGATSDAARCAPTGLDHSNAVKRGV